MSTMLDERLPAVTFVPNTIPLSARAAIGPRVHSLLDPVPVAPQPIRRMGRHWVRAARRLAKGALLLLEAPALVMLLGYAGMLRVHPSKSPATPLPASSTASRLSCN